MFSSTIMNKILKIPAKLFNNDPEATIQSYIGEYNTLMFYNVSNMIDNDLMLTVVVYYRSLDTSRVYYVKPLELTSTQVDGSIVPTYISNMVTIKLPGDYSKYKIVPLTVMSMDKPVLTQTHVVLSNYLALPLKTPYKMFTSNSTLGISFKQCYMFDDNIFDKSSVDINNSTNSKHYTLDDLSKIIEDMTNIDISITELEELYTKFVQVNDLKSPQLKEVKNYKYIKQLPDKLPQSSSTGYITYYDKHLHDFIHNYKLGMLIAPSTRITPTLIIYIPSMTYTITEQQLNTFEELLANDIITAHNFKIISKQ